MIIKATVIGMKYGVSKEKKEYTTLCVDVTDTIPENERVGMICAKTAVWGKHPKELLGSEVLCSVDEYGRLKDVSINSVE